MYDTRKEGRMAGKLLTDEFYNNICLNSKCSNVEEAICLAGELLVQNHYAAPDYIQGMLERELEHSTYIDFGVMIPHGIDGSEQYINASRISFIQVPDGVDYGGETAYIVMGVAGKDGTHLDILMQLAGIICETENIEKLRNAKTKQEVLDIIGNLEA